jgi:phage gpG-like protein
MSEIDQYISSLDSISNNLKLIAYKAIKKNQGQILTMVKLRLFNRGIDGSGSKITPEYAPETIKIKKGKGQRKSHVTLRDSGNLYRSFVVEFKNNNIFIETNVDYKKDLIIRYGSEIFDLTINEVTVIIYSFIETEVNKELNKLGL